VGEGGAEGDGGERGGECREKQLWYCNGCQCHTSVGQPDTPPAEFTMNEEERMYQFLLIGGSFKLGNQAVHHKLKAFLINSMGWAWIEWHDTAKNGCVA
jgi:hypothetical protein